VRLEKCEAVFDARADNLQFINRIANDIGATSAILRDRSEKYNSGWFDIRADDRFCSPTGNSTAITAFLPRRTPTSRT
jgi:hypothetical protein